MKGIAGLFLGVAAFTLFGCAKNAASTPSAETAATAVSMAQADSYILYAYAVRDAKAMGKNRVPEMAVRAEESATVYEFKDHIIKECGTHLTGTVTIAETADARAIAADFSTVTENPYGITSFAFDISEPMGEYRRSTGTATVNGRTYPIGEIIRVSRY